jgi:integrase
MKFTDKYISNLKPKAARYTVQEENAHGNGTLRLRVSPNGHKAWEFTYSFDGRVRRLTLGTYPAMGVADVHAACGEAMRKRESGIDPGAVAVDARTLQRKAPTFNDLADRYLKEWAQPRKRSWKVDEAMLKRDVLPTWGPHKAEAIQRKDVRALLQVLVDRGSEIQANRLLALVRKVYNWGIAQDLVAVNPCDRLAAPAPERQRERMLSESDLQAFLSALPTAAMGGETKLALRLLILTAQRPGEILTLRWSEIDEPAGWWTIPGAKAKNKKPHRVPLSPQAVEVLREAKALNPKAAHVFPSPRLVEDTDAKVEPGEPAPRKDVPMGACSLALAVRRNLSHFGVAPFRPHDLRRTAASHMTGLGISRLVVSKILNHTDPTVTAVYDRNSYDKDKREALDTWGRKLAGLVARTRLAVAS